MNFLAHCLLAEQLGAGTGGVVGGVLGDFIKGSIDPDLPADIAHGVRLHRRVDALSNASPGIARSIRRFPPPHRRYAPIYVDIIADHLLATSFERFSDASLSEFSQRCYAAIEAERSLFPEQARRFLDWMIEHDLFARYQSVEAVERAISNLRKRMRRPPDQTGLSEMIRDRLEPLRADFDSYFPALLDDLREASGASAGR